MREILFRGKRIDNGQWVQSKTIMYLEDESAFLTSKVTVNCVCDETLTNIVGIIPDTSCPEENPFAVKVDPESIGQYTGLTDKNGTKIFEGDILQYRNKYCGDRVLGYMEYGAYNCGCCHTVYGFSLCSNPDEEGKKRYDGAEFGEDAEFNADIVVIGNIHDNPELIKNKENNYENQ